MIQRPVISDYKELLTFENRVFNVRFLSKVPKLYKDPAKCISYHSVVRENDKIIGAIAAYPSEIITSAGSLKAMGIGSVAVDKNCRGKGIMKDMMKFCDDYAAEIGADIGFLGGYRQRYEHYGYTPCGTRYYFEISDYYINHFKGDCSYTFEAIKKDRPALFDSVALFNSQPYHWLRPDGEFELITTTWFEKCFSIRDKDGKFAGYLITEKFKWNISELVLVDESKASEVLVSFAKAKKFKMLKVIAEESQVKLFDELTKIGEHMSIQTPADFKIYNFKKFIEVLGTYKAENFNVISGSLILKIEDETLKITVADKVCKVEATDEKADLELTKLEAAIALTTNYGKKYNNALLNAWAPLCTLGMPRCDGV